MVLGLWTVTLGVGFRGESGPNAPIVDGTKIRRLYCFANSITLCIPEDQDFFLLVLNYSWGDWEFLANRNKKTKNWRLNFFLNVLDCWSQLMSAWVLGIIIIFFSKLCYPKKKNISFEKTSVKIKIADKSMWEDYKFLH